MKHWPFEVVNDDTKPKIKVDYKGETKTFFPEEVSSLCMLIYSLQSDEVNYKKSFF